MIEDIPSTPTILRRKSITDFKGPGILKAGNEIQSVSTSDLASSQSTLVDSGIRLSQEIPVQKPEPRKFQDCDSKETLESDSYQNEVYESLKDYCFMKGVMKMSDLQGVLKEKGLFNPLFIMKMFDEWIEREVLTPPFSQKIFPLYSRSGSQQLRC